MKDGVILRVNKPARMRIDDASLYPLQPCLPRGLRTALLRKQACYEIGCYENGTRGSLARPFPALWCFTVVFYRCAPRQTSRIPSLIAHADLAVFLCVESEGCIIGLK